MKKITLIIIACFHLSYLLGQECKPEVTWISPSRSSINVVKFANPRIGLAADDVGHLLQTVDSGNTWYANKSVGSYVRDIFMLNDKVWYIVTSNEISKTSDEGKTWTTTKLNFIITKIWVTSENSVYALSDYEFLSDYTFYKSNDGMKTWQILKKFNSSTFRSPSLYFVNDSTGFIGAIRGKYTQEYEMYKTNDFGRTWNSTVFQGRGITSDNAFYFTNDSIGYFLPKIATNNQGLKWEYVDTYPNNMYNRYYGYSPYRFNTYKSDSNTIFSFPGDGYIRKSIDGSITWKVVSAPLKELPLNINDVYFADSDSGYVLSKTKVFKSHNKGNNWVLDIEDSLLTGNKIIVNRNNTKYIVNPTLYRQNAASKKFEKVILNTLDDISGICFPSKDTGYVYTQKAPLTIGTKREIFRTFDDGITWRKLTFFSLDEYFKIVFTSGLVGYVTTGKELFKTTNGGMNWSKIILPSAENISGLEISDQKEVYIIVGNTLMYSADGGSSWINISTTVRADSKLYILKSAILFSAINSSSLQLTLDKGKTIVPFSYSSEARIFNGVDSTAFILSSNILVKYENLYCYKTTPILSGIEDQDSNAPKNIITVFPNPFTESFTFNLIGQSLKSETYLLEVFDSQGAIFSKVRLNEINNYTFERGLLKNGLYCYRLLEQDGRLIQSGKIVAK